MYGEEKDMSPKITLRKPGAGNKFKFMRGSTNTFSITTKNLSTITAIELEVSKSKLVVPSSVLICCLAFLLPYTCIFH